MAKLIENTVVLDEAGSPTSLLADTELPDWARGQVGKHLLDGDDEHDDDDGDGDNDGDGGDDVEVPPKGGPGSGADMWRAYAAAKDVEVAADADRDAVIAALKAAGVPTEKQ